MFIKTDRYRSDRKIDTKNIKGVNILGSEINGDK